MQLTTVYNMKRSSTKGITVDAMDHVEDLSASEDIAKARDELAELEQQLLDGTIW